jgi:PST family polysaccharide transporter
MTLLRKVKNASIWQTIEVLVTVAAQFIYMATMARILSKPDFGLMAIANSFVFFGYIFAESGMGAALIQRQNITNKHINAALQGGVLFGLILFFLFFILSPRIAIFFAQPQLENIIRVIAINFFIFSTSAVSMGILQKEFRFKEKSLVTIFSIITAYATGIYLGLSGYGVWSLIVAVLLISIFRTIGYFYFARIQIIKGLFFKEWRDLFSFGFGAILLRITQYIGANGINLILGKIFSPALLGVFERSYQIKTIPASYIGNIIDTVMFPALSQIQDEEERLFKIYQEMLGAVNTIFIPAVFYFIFFSKEIVLILLGKNWPEAVTPLQIMFVALPFIISLRMADSVIRAKGLIYKNARRRCLFVIVLLCSVSYGGYNYGLIGAAVGVTISYLFNYFTMLLLVRKVFEKNILEIFYAPIMPGLKLMLFLMLIVVSATTLFNQWGAVNISYFLIQTLFIGSLALIILWKKPSIFGEYFKNIILKINRPNDK